MGRLVVSTLAAALLLFTCGDRSGSTTETVTDRGTTVPPPATGFDGTATTDASPAPTTTAGARETTMAVPTTVGGVADWATCTNAERGYSIRHPAGWTTAYGCRYLDPEPLDIPPNTDGFFAALIVVDGDTSFDQARQRADDRFFVVLLREETTVGDRRAVRYETEATGEGMFDEGSRLYSVIIDDDGRAFEILTAWFPGSPTSEYQLRKQLVDKAAGTVRFL